MKDNIDDMLLAFYKEESAEVVLASIESVLNGQMDPLYDEPTQKQFTKDIKQLGPRSKDGKGFYIGIFGKMFLVSVTEERSLDKLLTSEMTPNEWEAFRTRWMVSRVEGLQVECDFSENEAVERAEHDFERFCGQEGWTRRDERIAIERERGNS